MAEKPTSEQLPLREYEPVSLGEEGEKQLSEAVSRVGEARVLSVLESLARDGKGLDVHITDMASRTGQEPEAVRAQVDQIRERFVAAAEKATGMDSASYAAFCEWAGANRGDALAEACRAFVTTADPRGLVALSREYGRTGATYSNADLLSAEVPAGVRVFESQGEVMIAIPGQGTMRMKDAMRQGIVSVK